MFKRTALVTALLFSVLPTVHAELPAPVTEQLAKVGLVDSEMAAMVVRIDDGAVLLSQDPDRPMQPASTMKMFTTTAAMHLFGPTFRTSTLLQSGGKVEHGVLKGDLVLRGGGDGYLTVDTFREMLQALRFKGIHRIKGDLILERSLYQPARMDLIEPPFDETPEQDEDFVPDAISLNQNLFKLDLTSDSEALHISFAPGLKYVRFTSDMTLNDLPCSSWFRGWTSPTVEQSRHDFKVVLHGSFPKNCAKHPAISVMDRTMYAELLFTKLWNELGGSFSGKAVEGTAAVDLPVLAEHKSRSLNELNIDIVKESDNVLARMLFHSLGSYQVDSATSGKISLLPADGVNTLVRADRVVRDWLRSQNIDDSGLVFEFGSGLSRKEMIKPSQMVALMKVIYKSNWAPEIMTSMPLVGLDGTMKSRLKNHPVTGRARIKTGTLRNVVAIAGFVPDAQGRTCIVVGFINSDNMKNGSGRAALNALIDWTARSGG